MLESKHKRNSIYVLMSVLIYSCINPRISFCQFNNIELSEKVIKLSGEYKWAEYPSLDRNESIELAQKSLIQKISTTIRSSTVQSVEETNTTFTDSFKSTTTSFSLLKLNGVDFITNQKRDRSFVTLAFISNSDLTKSLEISRQTQIENWKKIEGYKKQNRINQQLPAVVEAYYQTYSYPGNVFVSTSDGDSAIVKNLLKNELDRVLQQLFIVAKPAKGGIHQDIVDIRIQIELLTNDQKPLNGVILRPKLPNYAFQDVYDGRVEVSLDRLPSAIQQDLIIEIKPKSRGTELSKSLSEITPIYEKSIQIDYSDIIEFDIDITELTGGGFRLSPKVENVSITSLDWRINDESVSSRPSFTVLKSQLNEGDELVMRVNANPKLEKRYRIQNGQFSSHGMGKQLNKREHQLVSEASSITESDSNSTGEFENDSKNDSFSNVSTRSSTPVTQTTPFLEDPSEEDSDLTTNANNQVNNQEIQSGLLIPSVIQEIYEIRNARLLLMKLRDLRSRGILTFGNQSSVPSPAEAYVAIIDPKVQIILDFLLPEKDTQDNSRESLLTKKKISSISQTYKGYGAIYISIY